jgi:hypothetical protein
MKRRLPIGIQDFAKIREGGFNIGGWKAATVV